MHIIFMQVKIDTKQHNTVTPVKIRIMTDSHPTCLDDMRWVRLTVQPTDWFTARMVANGLGELMGLPVDL